LSGRSSSSLWACDQPEHFKKTAVGYHRVETKTYGAYP
jgi:hypothetical protein